MVEIRRVYEANFRVYGVRKVCGSSPAKDRCGALQGGPADAKRWAWLASSGRRVRPPIPDPAAALPLDRVNRQFQGRMANRLWVADFTYIATGADSSMRAFVIDVFARRIVGWRVSRSAGPTSCSMPWSRPCTSAPPSPAAACLSLGSRIAICDIRLHRAPGRGGREPSVGSVGDSYDNALAER